MAIQFRPSYAQHDLIDLLARFALGIFDGQTDRALETLHVGDRAATETARLLAPCAKDLEIAGAGAVISAYQARDFRTTDVQRRNGAGRARPHKRLTPGLNVCHQLRAASLRAVKSGSFTGSR